LLRLHLPLNNEV